MILYIIGNGFDIAHDIKCRYSDFHNYLIKNNIDFTLSTLLDTFPLDLEWSNFEDALSSPNELIERQIDSLDYGVYVKETIQDGFNKWVKTLDLQPINTFASLKPNSIFLSFNYTSVLEIGYNINEKRVCHIHRLAADSYFFNNVDMAFGHGKKCSPDKENTLVGCLYKDTSAYFEASKHFFDDWMYKIEKVVIIGFSYSTIDLYYFKKIKEMTHNPKWYCGFHTEKDKKSAEKYMSLLGIKNYDLSKSNADLMDGKFI